MPVLPSYRNQSIDLQANQLTGFFMKATLALNGLIISIYFPDYSSFSILWVLEQFQ